MTLALAALEAGLPSHLGLAPVRGLQSWARCGGRVAAWLTQGTTAALVCTARLEQNAGVWRGLQNRAVDVAAALWRP